MSKDTQAPDSDGDGRDDSSSLRASMRRLYRDISGYEIPRDEVRAIRERRGSPTYGAINFASVHKLITHLELGEDDVLYDLGSGVGKMVLQVAMAVPLRKCVGIEMSPSRHQGARAALSRARELGLLRARECELVRGDFMEADLSDATVIYTCSTTFSDRLMRRLMLKLSTLTPGLRFITTRHPIVRHGFEEVDELRLDMSWHRRSPVFVYRLPPPSPRRPRPAHDSRP